MATNREILFIIKMRNAARGELNSLGRTLRALGGNSNSAASGMQAYARAITAANAAAIRLNATVARTRLPSVPGGGGGRGAASGAAAGGFVGSSIHSTVATAAAAVGGVIGVSALKDMADTYKNLQGVISLVVDGQQEQAEVLERLRKGANDTRQAFEPTVDLFGRMARASRNMVVSNEELLKATTAVNQAILLSRASTAAATASLIQLGQALGSDRLGGDELRSIAEQTPILAQAIIDGLDDALVGGQSRTIATLKKLGAEGQLTAEVVFNAIQSQQASLAAQFEKVPLTIGQSMNVLRNNLIDFVGKADAAYGVSQKISEAIIWLGKNLETVARVLKILLVPLLGVTLPLAAKVALAAFAGLAALVGPWGALAIAIATTAAALYEFRNEIVLNTDTGRTLGDVMKAIAQETGSVTSAIKLWVDEMIGTKPAVEGAVASWSESFETFADKWVDGLDRFVADTRTMWMIVKDLFDDEDLGLGTKTTFEALWNSNRGRITGRTNQNTKDRQNGASEAARFAREQARLVNNSLNTARAGGGGGSTTDAAAAKKFADAFQSLQDKLSPVLARMREYREAVATINEAEQRGVINGAQRTYLLEQANLKLGANTSELAVANKALEEQARLIGLTSQQREIEAAVTDLQNKAIEAGNNLSATELENYRKKFQANQSAQSVSDFARLIADRVKGIEQETAMLELSNEQRARQIVLNDLNNEADQRNITDLQTRINLIGDVTAALAAQKGVQDALNGSFEYGFSTAFHDFAEQAKNVALATKDAWTSALNGTADAITDLITTGKANFKSLIDSLLHDLVRIQVVKYLGKGIDFLGGTEMFGSAHTGAIVGAASAALRVDPSVFAGARRYHTGGLIGNEVPIIAKKGEAVMPTVRMSDGNLGIRATGGVGGGNVFSTTVNVSVDGSKGGDPASNQKMGAEIARVVEEQLKVLMDEWGTTNMRNGGLFNRGLGV